MILNRRNAMVLALATAMNHAAMNQAALAQAPALPVVASFSILADMVRQIGGAHVAVTALVGANQDAHGFEPGPKDSRQVAAARVIVVNGLGYEPYMDRLIKSAGSKVRPTVVTAGITALDSNEKPGAGHVHGHADPHAWQSVRNARSFATVIAAALTTADPARTDEYARGLAAYQARLDALAVEIGAIMATIPADRRVLVTTHGAFRYLAAEFGLTDIALQGATAEQQPSAADMARIIRQLRQVKAPAVFLENISDPRKIEQIARESGARIGGTLYSDALSLENGPAATYIDMMRHNARAIAEALKP